MIETDIGARVRSLRDGAGLSQDALAIVLDLKDRQSISDIERGKRRLTADELVTLVKHFDVSFDQLTNPFLLSGKQSFSWRQKNVAFADLDRFEMRAGEWVGAYRELNRQNDVRLKNLLPRLGLTHESRFEDAASAGEAVADELGLGERPAFSLIEMLERKLGILLLMVDTIEGVSGAACRLQFLNAILVNRHERRSRRHSDIGHEVFHILTWDMMKPDRVESNDEAWERPLTNSQKRNLRIENLADHFSSGLLMPSRELDRLGDPHGNVIVWLTAAAQELGVSARNLKWRLVNSGRQRDLANIPNAALDEAAQRGDTEDLPALFSRNFMMTLLRAIEVGHLSIGRATKLTDLSRTEFGELCDAYALERPLEL